MASQTITALGNAIINLVDRKTPIATANTVGMVKPDGSTINIDANGVISSNGGGGSGLEVCDIGMALYVDETKGLRRYLNGQIVDINTNTQAFLDRLKQITKLYPSLLCTEEEWQTAKTMSAFGQVGKFVFNYSGENIVSVRLPRVVNVQGLFDLQNLGMTVSAGLPNITGTAQTAPGRSGYIVNGALAIYFTQNTTNVYLPGTETTNNQYGISLDASRSNPIYGKSTTVQEEAIQYPYFIQIATGQETENNIVNDIELNNPSFFGDSKYVPTAVNNLSWLKSEGQNNPKGTYPSFYDWILENVNKGVENFKSTNIYYFTNTIDGKEYWRATTTRNPIVGSTVYNVNLSANRTEITGTVTSVNGDTITVTDTYEGTLTLTFKQISSASIWLTDYDFVLNTADETFRLPLLDGSESLIGTTEIRFDSYATSNTFNYTAPQNGHINIVFSCGEVGDWVSIHNSTARSTHIVRGSFINAWEAVSMDVKRGDVLIIQCDDTAKDKGFFFYPFVGNGSLYYYVGETVQNADLIDAGRIGEILPTKVSKSGDTMTGDLVVPKLVVNCRDIYDSITLKSSNNRESNGNCVADITTYFPNNARAKFESFTNPDNGYGITQLCYHNPSTNVWYRLGIDSNGYVICNDKATHLIKDTYTNGKSGYNIWSNGYCEQWGWIGAGTGTSSVRYNFLKPFANDNFNITYSVASNENHTRWVSQMSLNGWDVNGFNAMNVGGFGAYWCARGYV